MIEHPASYFLLEEDFAAIPAEEAYSSFSQETPTISVLMLAWNHADYIDQAIDSVIRQKEAPPFEILIGEDCSTDDTRRRVDKWQSRYPEIIRIITSSANVGMHHNFARLWHHARGELIAFCEGDDYWTDPGRLAGQHRWFDDNRSRALCGSLTEKIEQDATGEWQVSGLSSPIEIKDRYNFDDLLRNYTFHFSSVMLRKCAVRFPRWFWDMYCVDRPLYLLAAEQGEVGIVPEVTSRYRQHPGGIWSQRRLLDKADASTQLFRQLASHVSAKHRDACSETLASILWFYMSEAMQEGDWEGAKDLWHQAMDENGAWLREQQGARVAKARARIGIQQARKWLSPKKERYAN